MSKHRITDNTNLFITLLSLFFIWGFITLMNDLLLPILKEQFSLTYFQAMFINFCFFISYGLFSIPASRVLKKYNYKIVIISGLLIISLGAIIMKTVYQYSNYYLLLLGLTIIAIGVICLQVSANPLMNDLGHKRTSSARLTLAQGINSLGYIVAPYLFAHIILRDNISPIYISIALVLVALSIFLSFVSFSKQKNINSEKSETTTFSVTKTNNFLVLMGIISIFAYVGAEVSAGSLIINYATSLESSSYTITTASSLLIFYWGGAMVGRLFGSYLLKKYTPTNLLLLFAIINILLIITVSFGMGHTSLYALLALGLFNSIMFPTIFSLTLMNTTVESQEKVSGYLITAIVGGAFIPLLQGKAADLIGLDSSFYILLPCYLIVAIFAILCKKNKDLFS